MNYKFQMLENECWWGGTTVDGCAMPYTRETELTRDFRINTPNQTMPLYLSNLGRCIWSETGFKVTISNGHFEMEGEEIVLETFGTCLKDAYVGAMNKYFPISGNTFPETFFQVPQYNTWMQLVYDQTQEGVMAYAKAIIANGFKPGILTIDEGWQKEYGIWEFDTLKFPEPKKMVDELHAMGFKLMLWVVPTLKPDGKFFVKHVFDNLSTEEIDNFFLRTDSNEIAITKWWNGYSAIFDMTKECDRNLLDSQLQALMDEYDIDGFKFDGGTVDMYSDDVVVTKGCVNKDYTPHERNIAWNEFGAKYEFHEYKDTFKGGGKRMIQRIRDRNHTWVNDGIETIIPNAISQGLIGHAFICPDMVGGGEWTYREFNVPADQELFVRMAQCSALFPMMQFSWAPWEALDKEHLALCKKAHDMHCNFSDEIMKFVNAAYENGEPIIRNLEYNYPHCGYEKISDIFMLGEDYLVAPIVEQGQTVKQIPLPEGTWLGFDGKEYKGGQTIELNVTLADLPYFKKL